jgi:hypothetical protein
MLEFTDTLAALTGNAEVICPTASKIYIAKNAVGSSRTVTLKTSAGTGIAIPDGTTMLLFCDGTNVVEAVTNINSLSVGGYTVTLAGAVSTAAAFSTAGANALTLTTTGTTNVTLPTTGTLATLAGTETFTNKTLTSPDINGGTIDNATIGATTATTGVFTNLTANTDLTLATGATVTGINTTTDMSDASTTTLATSDSIKQYVDAQVGANNELSEVLANGNTTGSNNIVVDAGQSITTDSILETTAAAGVDIDGVLLKDTSVGTDDASGTDISGNNVTFRGGAGTGTGAGGSLVFQTAPAGTTGSTPNAQVTAMTINSAGAVDMNVSLNVDGTVTADGLTVQSTATTRPTIGNSDVNTSGLTTGLNFEPISNISNGAKINVISGLQPTVASAYTAGFEFVTEDHAGGGSFAQTKALTIGASGDISFYEDTGTTAKLFWDASAESLGIGTTSPSRVAEITSATSSESYLRISGNSGNVEDTNFAGIEFYNTDSSGAGPNVAAFIEARAETATGAGAELVFATSLSSDSEGARATERLRIDSSGRVGIGTASPETLLMVEQAGTYTGVHDTAGLKIRNAAATTGVSNPYGAISLSKGTGSAGIAAIGDSASDADVVGLGFFVHGSTTGTDAATRAMTINSSGQVFVGTTDNSTSVGNLIVKSDSNAHAITIEEPAGAGETWQIGVDVDGDLGFYNSTSTTASVTLDDSGNVGIGTTTVNRKLEVSGNNNAGSKANFIRITDTDTSATAANPQGGIEFYTSDTGNENVTASIVNLYAGSGAGSELTFNTAPSGSAGVSERMRIDSSGNVGIGVSPAKTLDVRTSSGSDAVIRVGSSSSIGINVNVGAIEFYSADADDAGVKASIANYVTGNEGPGGAVDGNLIFSTTDSDGGGNDSPTERMRIDSQGQVRLSNTTPVWDTSFSSLVTKGGFVGSQLADYLYSGQNAYYNGGFKFSTAANATIYEQSFGAHTWYRSTDVSPAADATITLEAAMTLDASGNLLVGKLSSTGVGTRNIEVSNASSATVQIEGGTNEWSLLVSSAADALRFYEDSTERMRIDSSGNLLVGTTDTTPWDNSTATAADDGIFLGGGRLGLAKWGGVPLLVNRTDSDGEIAIFYKDGAPVGSIASTDGTDLQIGSGNCYLRFDDATNQILPTNAAGAKRDNTVDLGEPDSRFKDLHAGGRGFFNLYSAGINSGNIMVGEGVYVGAANGDNQIRSSSAGGGSATLYIGNAAIQVSSDQRLKTNIVDTEMNATEKLNQVRVVDFNWDDPSDTSFNNRNARGKWTGVLAQELVDVLPFAVNAPRNEEDLSIDEESDQKWLVDQAQMVPVLIKAIQELTARIATLEGAN